MADPAWLSAGDAAALDAPRWRVEDAWLAGKRLVGPACCWTGALHSIPH